MSKDKFLLVEFTAHFRNAYDNFKFFKKYFNCFFLIDKKNENKVQIKKGKIVFLLPKFLIHFYILLQGYKYKFIYLSTPHEYPDYPNGLKQKLYFIYEFILYIFIFKFYKKKIIIQLRGIHRYFADINTKINKPGFYSYLRNLYLHNCNIIICESKFLRKTLIKKIGLKNCKNRKIWVFYYAYPQKKRSISVKYKKNLNIGILGSVDPIRKNYDQLLILLKNKFFQKRNVTLTFLGSAQTKFASNKINYIRNYCNKIVSKKYFSDKEFLKYGKNCDFLISLNTTTNFYGKYRMSGCFGDAILLEKPLYCPKFEDPNREFNNFTIYFDDISKIVFYIKKYTKFKQIISFDHLNLKENILNVEKEI